MASETGHEGEAPLFGVSAEFDDPHALLAAVLALRDRRFGRLDCFTPVPVAGLGAALRLRTTSMHWFAGGGVGVGFVAMMGMCLYASGYDYVFDIGGRPRFSWQSFVVPSVSFAMLGGAVVVTMAMLLLNRLPRLNHPAFNIPGFGRMTQDRFFLAVEARDDDFDCAAVEAALSRLAAPPLAMHRVPR
jgi:hypothetical protein